MNRDTTIIDAGKFMQWIAGMYGETERLQIMVNPTNLEFFIDMSSDVALPMTVRRRINRHLWAADSRLDHDQALVRKAGDGWRTIDLQTFDVY